MKESPILFNGDMVRAILSGAKTQTRRIVRPQPEAQTDSPYHIGVGRDRKARVYPLGKPGDRLWVRETWAQRLDLDHLNGTQLYERGIRTAWYWADGPGKCCNTGCAGAAGRVRAARFMPRWASRITLEITGIRVERLQEISENDAKAEGVRCGIDCPDHRIAFGRLWRSIYTSQGTGWDANPWVWVIEFRRIEADVMQHNDGDHAHERSAAE